MEKSTCDRCHQSILLARTKYFTSGYYEMSGWPEFRNAGEKKVCDWCIHIDQRYIDVYGETAESKHQKKMIVYNLN